MAKENNYKNIRVSKEEYETVKQAQHMIAMKGLDETAKILSGTSIPVKSLSLGYVVQLCSAAMIKRLGGKYEFPK